MKQMMLTLSLLCMLGLQSQSQTNSKKEKIKYLFSLMHQDSLINKTFDAMSASMTSQMATLFKDTLHSNAGSNYSEKIAAIMATSLQTSKENAKRLINEDMVDIYDKYFSIAEVEDFITFYTSASGQKMLNKMPDITKDIMAAMTLKYQPAMLQTMQKQIAELYNNPQQ